MLVCLVVIVCTCKKIPLCNVFVPVSYKIKINVYTKTRCKPVKILLKQRLYIWQRFSKTNPECKWPLDMTSGIRWGGRVIYLDISNWDISIKDPGWFRTGSPTPWVWVLESVSSLSGEGSNPVRYDRPGLQRQRCPGNICSDFFTGKNSLAGCVVCYCCCWLS